jgi:hypothetical protein
LHCQIRRPLEEEEEGQILWSRNQHDREFRDRRFRDRADADLSYPTLNAQKTMIHRILCALGIVLCLNRHQV